MNSSSRSLRREAITYLCIAAGLLLSLSAFAQSGDAMLQKMSDEDQESLKALVMYPAETREAIFVAAQQPAALIKMEKIQERTAEHFNEVIASKDKDTQRGLWDLTRYPGLISDIAAVGPKNEPRLMKALEEHPEIIRTRALQMYDQQFSAISKIASLKADGDDAFGKLMKGYTPETKAAMSQLLDHPEVLGLLNESMDLTVTVGDMYRQDPAGMLALAERLNGEVAEENAKELNDWRERLEDDPAAMEEYQNASDEFKNEYQDDDVYYSEQDAKNDNEEKHIDDDGGAQEVHHYYHYSYPYWFSYPRWYNYPHWRPYPVSFHWGFNWRFGWRSHYGWGNHFGWGMPSGYFMNWYYSYPYHYNSYPALACHYSAHWHGHRNSHNALSTSTGEWHRRNRDVLPGQLDPSRASSIEAVRDLGRMETARIEHNRVNPGREQSRSQFLAQRPVEYSALAATSPSRADASTSRESSRSSANTRETSTMERTSSGSTSNAERTRTEGARSSNSSATNSRARSGTSATRPSSSSSNTRQSTSSRNSGTARQQSKPSRSSSTSSKKSSRSSSTRSNSGSSRSSSSAKSSSSSKSSSSKSGSSSRKAR